MDTAKEFFYHAHGHALGGVITFPISQTLDSVAAASLPITGGHGHAKAEAYKLQELVSYSGASCEVSGAWNEQGAHHQTEITSIIEGVNINNVVTADRIVGRLLSKHKPDDLEGCIVADGSEFVNLRIGGFPCEIELDTKLFVECDTLGKFKDKHQNDPDFRNMARKRFLWGDIDSDAPDWLKQRYSWVKPADALPESKGIVPVSVIKSVRCMMPGLKIYGNVMIVPDFGKIFLGELLLEEGSRRLTMMRLEMGSPLKGTMVMSAADNNGTSFP